MFISAPAKLGGGVFNSCLCKIRVDRGAVKTIREKGDSLSRSRLSINENDKGGFSGVEMVRPSTLGVFQGRKGDFWGGRFHPQICPYGLKSCHYQRRLAVDLTTRSLGPKKKDVVTVLAFLSSSFSVHLSTCRRGLGLGLAADSH